MAREHILVVDDEAEIRALCRRTLTREGYDVSVAANGLDALQYATEHEPHVAVLDVLMPGMDGIELCRSLHSISGLSNLPILFLTAKQDITDKAAGFAAGGDDYLTKPFDIRELALRVRALLRRRGRAEPAIELQEVVVSDLRLDCRNYQIATPEKTSVLTVSEFELMRFLMCQPGRVLSSRVLLQDVFGYPPGIGSTDLVRTHVRNIRLKIEPDPSAPRYLRTVGRLGYVLSE